MTTRTISLSQVNTLQVGKVCRLAIALASLASGSVLARTVTVVSCDHDTGETTLAISAAEAGDGAKALVAAWSPCDIGNDSTRACESVYVGAVSVAETTKTFTIPAAWRAKTGFVKFFLMNGVPPYDARLKSLRAANSANAYIDTGFVPTTDTDIRVTAFHPYDMAPFGISGKVYLFSNSASSNKTASYYYGFFGIATNVSNVPRGDSPHELWLNSTGVHIDGSCYATFDPAALTGSTTSTLTLFARKNDGAATVAKTGDCTIYSAQIRENGVLEHDFVPCVKNGVVTMYDRRNGNGVICTVSGGGSFTAGDEVGPDAQDCGGVESATAAIAFGPTMTVTSTDSATGDVTVSLAGTHDGGVLYAVADVADRGTTVSDWQEICFLGKVAADATSATVTVPAAWFVNGYQIRLLLRSAADFPYDREVEWLYSAGSAWVNSGTFPTQKTTLSVCGKGGNQVALAGLSGYQYILPVTDTIYYGFFGVTGTFTLTDFDSVFHTYTMGPDGILLDGTVKDDFAGKPTSYTGMAYRTPIFFRRNTSSGNIEKNGHAWIKSAKIWEEGRLVRDFVPCVSNGVACLYDRVSQAFFGSQTAATFEPGETSAIVADAEAVCWSAPFATSVTSATWDGGGVDNSFATAANWEGDVLPDLSSGSTMLTFATGGASAEVASSGAVVMGLNFDTANDFSLTAASGASLALGGGGITLADRATSETWRMHNLDLPVVLTADQTWDLSSEARQRIRVLGNIQGAAGRKLTVAGSGCLSIHSTNDFSGSVELVGGTIKVFSKLRPFGSGANGGEIIFDLANDAFLELWGAVIDKPIRIIGAVNAEAGRFACRDSYGDNEIAAPIYQSSNQSGAMFALWQNVGATLTFSGGGTFDGPVELLPESSSVRRMVIKGSPIVCRDPWTRSRGFHFHGKTELHLKNQNNVMFIELGAAAAGGGSELHCWTNNVLNYLSDIILGHGSVMDLHGFDQTVGDLKAGISGRVRSDTPATLLANYDNTSVSEVELTSWGVSSGIEGAVSFTKSGAASVTINGTNTTTGVLTVLNGPLTIGTTGVWHGTNVVIGITTISSRHPSLRLTHNGCFADPKHTILRMTTSTASMNAEMPNPEPELILDEGVRPVFAEVWINGQRLAGGTWGGAESNARYKDAAHFSGKGLICVRGGGLMISFR